MSSVFPEGSAKAGAEGNCGGPDQYSGTWGLACDRENARRRGLRRPSLGFRGQGSLWMCSGLVGGLQFQLSWLRQVSRKYTARYGRQEEDLLSTQWVRLFCDTTEVSGVVGDRLQRRRGHDWLTEQADSGGRLHVNRSGSKRRHRRVQRRRRRCHTADGDEMVRCW
jgi:hypothetical protein